jgi:hypothetical protein
VPSLFGDRTGRRGRRRGRDPEPPCRAYRDLARLWVWRTASQSPIGSVCFRPSPLQQLVPGTVLVGLADLEAAAGWTTNRVQRPVLVLGQLEGMLTGIRQLRRIEPLETVELDGLQVPTLAEMARIKLWLLATRHTTRDYLDTVVLFERLGEAGVRNALVPFDRLYAQAGGADEPVTHPALEASRALWNRRELDLSSDEVLAQILDRGEMALRCLRTRLAICSYRTRARRIPGALTRSVLTA